MASTPRWPTLEYGQSGPNVWALQYLLKSRAGVLNLTGTYDRTTETAVKNFQSQNRLTVTGKADGEVLSLLNPVVRQISDPVDTPQARAAQYLLRKFQSLTVDGLFGGNSANATAAFQIRMGISITGIVTPQTWQYLFGYNSYPTNPVTPPTTTVYASVCTLPSTLTSAQMETNAKYIYNWLKNKGFKKSPACAVLGNIQVESVINPGIWQIMSNTSLGYGLVQWTKASDKFLKWAADNNKIKPATAENVNDYAVNYPKTLMDAELEFLIADCSNPQEFGNPSDFKHPNNSGYTMTFKDFMDSSLDAETLAVVFHDHYERTYSTASLAERKSDAKYWYGRL